MNNIYFTLISWKRAFSEILILSWRNLKNWHMRWKISGIHEITWKFFILLCYSHILCNLRLLIWHHFGSFVSFNLSFANFRLHINSKHIHPIFIGLTIFLTGSSTSYGSEAKVLELSDRFLPLRHEGMWLVMVILKEYIFFQTFQ